MRTRFQKLSKFFLFICIFLCSSVFAFAAENSLLGIDVQQQGESYNVMLKLNNNADIQRMVNAQDSLTIVLKETVPTDSVEIIYDNAADLENVIVQKKNNGNTLILLEGKAIENASIYTKDLSTGLVSQAGKEKSLNNYLFIADKKIAGFSILGLVMFFMLMLSLRPKNKRYNSNVKNVKTQKSVSSNTLRNKNINQSRSIPSINYKVNGGFSKMSIPKDFVINNHMASEREQIRKAG